jgi:GntR family transcriptional regulator
MRSAITSNGERALSDLRHLKLIMLAADRIDPLAPIPPYRQIAAILKRKILSGQYPPNSRIPTESELIETFEVARTTARRAVGGLRDEGLVYSVPH